MDAKASTAQAKFINAILKRGGNRVSAARLFPKNEIRSRREFKTMTIRSCRERGWVTREDSGGTWLWTVTDAGRSAVGAA
jgi:hypothetical protein